MKKRLEELLDEVEELRTALSKVHGVLEDILPGLTMRERDRVQPVCFQIEQILARMGVE